MFQATHDYLLSKYQTHFSHGTALIGATKMTENGEFAFIIVFYHHHYQQWSLPQNDDDHHDDHCDDHHDDHDHDDHHDDYHDGQGNGVGLIVASGSGRTGKQANKPSDTNVLIKILILGKS